MALSASDLERWWLVSVWRVGDVLLQSLYYVCRQHKEEVAGDIFDMLLTFTDFLAFKEMFLAYRTVSSSAIFPFYFFFLFLFFVGGGVAFAFAVLLCHFFGSVCAGEGRTRPGPESRAADHASDPRRLQTARSRWIIVMHKQLCFSFKSFLSL